jgi:hypothetical protein
MFQESQSMSEGVVATAVLSAVRENVRYDRLDAEGAWPLEPGDTNQAKIQKILALGLINCQLAIHLFYALELQLNLPAEFRSMETWEDQRFFTTVANTHKRVLRPERLQPGDVFFFASSRTRAQPELYHQAVLSALAPDGNHQLLHAVSRKDVSQPPLVSVRLHNMQFRPHRELLGVRRITQEGRVALASEESLDLMASTLLHSFN